MSVDVYPTPADVTLGTMSVQNANAVAITDGYISLGGHTPTGVLDVQGSVVASDIANAYIAARVWPLAPSGATNTNGMRIEPSTGAGLATCNFRGLAVLDQPAGFATVHGLSLQQSTGTGRYNVYAQGSAPNYFAGNVGCGVVPGGAFIFDALGNTRFRYDKTNQWGIQIQQQVTDAGTGGMLLFINVAGTVIGSIASNATSVTYNTSSDVRLKHSIEKLVGALDVVQLLNPISFLWKADNSPGVGFRADELQQVIPEAVTGEPDALNEDGSINPQQVDLSKLVPWLTAALQETIAQVEALTARVIALEARLV